MRSSQLFDPSPRYSAPLFERSPRQGAPSKASDGAGKFVPPASSPAEKARRSLSKQQQNQQAGQAGHVGHQQFHQQPAGLQFFQDHGAQPQSARPHAYMHTSTRTHAHTHTHTRMHTHMHDTHTRTYTHTHTHTHTHRGSRGPRGHHRTQEPTASPHRRPHAHSPGRRLALSSCFQRRTGCAWRATVAARDRLARAALPAGI